MIRLSDISFKTALDLDGVLGDFDNHFKDLFGLAPDELRDIHGNDSELWRLIDETPNFWIDMSLMPGALDLWERVSDYNPYILTGCPKTNFEHAAAEKRRWVAKYIGKHVRVETCRSKDKPKFITDYDDILIDDRYDNTSAWESAGGRAILFLNTSQAIRDFKKLVDG